MLLLLLGPLLLFGALVLRDRADRQLLLPDLEPAAVAEIELSHGEESLLLRKRAGIGPWEIRSAADAPGDAARIGALLDQLAGLEGRPVDGAAAPEGPPIETPAAAPIEVRLADADGRAIARLAFWNGEARRLVPEGATAGNPASSPVNGPLLKLRANPLLPLWPSPWSNLQPPKIDSSRLARVERITRAGPQPLDDGAAAGVALILGKLTAVQFVPAFDLDWTGAGMLRLTMRDGTVIDAFQTMDRGGRSYVRFESATDAEVEAVRRFAFRTAEPLP